MFIPKDAYINIIRKLNLIPIPIHGIDIDFGAVLRQRCIWFVFVEIDLYNCNN